VSTINSATISFDSAKNDVNVVLRQLAFTLVEELDWTSALIAEDERKDYGERRFQVLGFIGNRLHAVVFTPRMGKIHVISLRKANAREVKQYEQTSKN
jgi:uncharacterized DUF497 family protein